MSQSSPALKEAFLQLLREQERLLYKVCGYYATHPEDKKDLYQEIVLQCWHAFPRFRSEARASTWLYRIALNTAITHKRKEHKRIRPVITEQEFDVPEDLFSRADQEQYTLMQQMISALPPLERALLLLYFEDRPYTEIAEIMGISVSNVGTRLARIREKLKRNAQTISQS
jgi:RNA polymerase sigma-70 factor (ECF subfamily)